MPWPLMRGLPPRVAGALKIQTPSRGEVLVASMLSVRRWMVAGSTEFILP